MKETVAASGRAAKLPKSRGKGASRMLAGPRLRAAMGNLWMSAEIRTIESLSHQLTVHMYCKTQRFCKVRHAAEKLLATLMDEKGAGHIVKTSKTYQGPV